MFDVIDRRRQGALKLGRHAAGHLIRRQPGVLPDHRDYRDPDVRKDVDGCAQGGDRTDDENDQGKHDKRVGTLKCNADKGYHAADVSWSGGMPCAVSMQGASAYGDGGPCRIAQNRSDFFSMTIHKCVPIPSSYGISNDGAPNNWFSGCNPCGRQRRDPQGQCFSLARSVSLSAYWMEKSASPDRARANAHAPPTKVTAIAPAPPMDRAR